MRRGLVGVLGLLADDVGAVVVDLFEPGVEAPVVDFDEAEGAGSGVEVAWVHGAAGVDKEDAADGFDGGDVGVAVDDDVLGCAKVVLHHGFDGAVGGVFGEGHVVGEADAEAVELEVPGFSEARVLGLDGSSAGAVVAVASGDVDGGQALFQVVDEGDVVDIAAVEEEVDALESLPELRPEFGAGFGDVGVGDESDEHGVVA